METAVRLNIRLFSTGLGRNVEMLADTYRWRVTESSSILLLLLDSRCPPIHCPPSLRSYIQSLKPKKEVILMLTKCDLVDGSALEGWKAWIKAWWGEQVDVVCVMSYDLVYLKGRSAERIGREGVMVTLIVGVRSRTTSTGYTHAITR